MINKGMLFTFMAPAVLAMGAGHLAVANPADIHAAAAPARIASGPSPKAASAAPTTLTVAATGNEVRYRVRERLATMQLPYDAVGKTNTVKGALVIGADGKLVPGQSKIIATVTGLKSDQDRRDGMVQRRLLETDKYPDVVFEPTEIRGLAGALPTSGSKTFQLVGNLTVKGVTKPTVWDVTAQFQGGKVVGTASTSFTFKDFDIDQPSVPIILSLADTIKLEYDFTVTRGAQS